MAFDFGIEELGNNEPIEVWKKTMILRNYLKVSKATELMGVESHFCLQQKEISESGKTRWVNVETVIDVEGYEN